MSVNLAKRHAGAALLLLHGAVAMAAPASDAEQQARRFLLRYVGLTATADVAALDMYRDDARVMVTVWEQGREVQRAVTTGKSWKAQLRRGWFDGTSRMEAVSFEGASVSVNNSQLVIKARRYSQTRCYWDSNYTATIEPDSRGIYSITAESLTFRRDTACQTASPDFSPSKPITLNSAPTATQQITASSGGTPATPVNAVPSGTGLPRLPPRHISGPFPLPQTGSQSAATRELTSQ